MEIDQINTGKNLYHVPRVINVQRPQLNFEQIDNSKAIFVPKLKQKYNAKISLEEGLYMRQLPISFFAHP